MPEGTDSRRLDLCVIGAGSAGLCTLRHAKEAKDVVRSVVAFEQWGCTGGTWVYTEDKDFYGDRIHSSMYSCLRTTLPKEVMQFKDFPFCSYEKQSFLHHTQVLRYLKEYARHFDLNKHIKFYKKVKRVSPCRGPSGETKWNVTVEDVQTKEEELYVFDAVVVCNGHYTKPNVPQLPGIESFRGSVIHSHDFKKKDPYEGKTVVIWGASSSGLDIALEICSVAKKVIVSHKNPPEILSKLPKNVCEAANLSCAQKTGFEFEDGSWCEADVLIYCTGYLYDFPFLDEQCAVKVHDNHVTPLYKHLIHIEHPTMCFVGIPILMLPFILFDYQVRYFLRVLGSSVSLPSREAMLRSNEDEMKRRIGLNLAGKHSHVLDWLQWEYYEDLAECAELEKLPPVVRRIYDDTRRARRDEVMHYKTYVYQVLNGQDYVVQVNKKVY